MQIGTIEYEARVTGVAEAKQDAADFASTQEDVASSSAEAAAAGSFLAGTLSDVGDETEDAGEEADRTSSKTRILTSALFFLGSTAVGTIAKVTGLTGAFALVKGAAGTLIGTLSGLTLSGVLGSVSGAISGFVGWLAAGSAGALAFAGAIGFGLGVLGVWILKVTGALDAVSNFGQFVGNVLPGWVSDGILQMISLTAGPLAAFGAFITGTLEGGFDEGFRRAGQVVDIFIGAWQRQFDRAAAVVGDFKSDVVGFFSGLLEDARRLGGRIAGTVERQLAGMGDAAASGARNAFNSAVPDRVNIPSISVAGRTFGGGSINLPQLQVGGMVEGTGIAQVHKGEAVIPEPLVNAAQSGEGGGGGGGGVTIETLEFHMSGEFDPSNATRRDLQELARLLESIMGKDTNRRAGVR